MTYAHTISCPAYPTELTSYSYTHIFDLNGADFI
ncbi:hypothetical protein J2S21_001311 [Peribacillus cavernae]|nr:hypothetical protein [Peribacillus cavernae]